MTSGCAGPFLKNGEKPKLPPSCVCGDDDWYIANVPPACTEFKPAAEWLKWVCYCGHHVGCHKINARS